jgi:hypothetical protein
MSDVAVRRYLEGLDDLRDGVGDSIDEMLANIDVDKLIANPKKTLQEAVLKWLIENKKLFKDARKIGLKLAESLK